MPSETATSLPDEEDRKLFVGCLAAVLASSYDYDVTEEGSTSSSSSSSSIPIPSSSLLLEEEEDEETVSSSANKGSATENDVDSSSFNSKVSKKKQKTNQRVDRHRQRRYDVACNLLLSSAELLLVAKSEVEGLLPMLQKLMLPTAAATTTATTTTTTTTPVPPQTNASTLPDVTSDASLVAAVADAVVNPWKLKANELIHNNGSLKLYLEALSPGAGFQCLSLFVFQHLLSCQAGYDARIRHAIKTLAVTVLVHDTGSLSSSSSSNYSERVARATRKFESLERVLANRLVGLAKLQGRQSNAEASATNDNNDDDDDDDENYSKKSISRKHNMVRGLKVGTAGLLAGGLLVVTGGMAAPGIAAGLAALGMGAIAGTFLTLASSGAVIALFGASGGSLAMYKMNRRTEGLTEFEFQQEGSSLTAKAELSRTICVSGWLRDAFDFQRPWGVVPSKPPLSDKLELMKRFYSIYNPEHVPYSEKILKRWEGEDAKLWKLLRNRYGQDPDNLFPLDYGPSFEGALSKEEEKYVDNLIVEVGQLRGIKKNNKPEGFESPGGKSSGPLATFRAGGVKMRKDTSTGGSMLGKSLRSKWGQKAKHSTDVAGTKDDATETSTAPSVVADTKSAVAFPGGSISGEAVASKEKTSNPFSRIGFGQKGKQKAEKPDVASFAHHLSPTISSESDFELVPSPAEKPNNKKEHGNAKPLASVWDYQANYGGELYTIKWESELMLNLCNSVKDLAYGVASTAGKEALKQTVAATLIIAAALPAAIYSGMNSIDGTWTLVIERADAAGRELARSLLVTGAGHRPVTLVGYSFGARVIYSCLKELARCQEEWEEHQETKTGGDKAGGDVKEKIEFDCEPASVVEDVIIMGAPLHLKLAVWRTCREIVAGRLVNVYSRKDRMLAYMFKYKRLIGGLKPVCGTCTVAVAGVENMDVSDIVAGHADYCLVAGDILKRIRHGQPLRYSSNAIDEMALIAEVESLALKDETS